MSGIDKETGEIIYPYLDHEGRVICDPTPKTVAVGITQIGLDENRVPNTLYQGFDLDDDGNFDSYEDDEVLPMTQYEIDGSGLESEEAPEPEEAPKEEGVSPQPPLE